MLLGHSPYTVTFNIYNQCVILTAPECENSGSTSAAAVAAVGGVLAAVTAAAIILLVVVIVVFMRRLHRAEAYTTAQPLQRYYSIACLYKKPPKVHLTSPELLENYHNFCLYCNV